MYGLHCQYMLTRNKVILEKLRCCCKLPMLTHDRLMDYRKKKQLTLFLIKVSFIFQITWKSRWLVTFLSLVVLLLFLVPQWLAKELSQHHTTEQHRLAVNNSLRLISGNVNFEGPLQHHKSEGTVAKSKRSETKTSRFVIIL